MMPCSCADSSASAICLAIGSASSSGIGTPRDAIGERRALDQLHHQRSRASGLLDAVNVGDVRMVERGKDLGFALKPREPVGVGRDRRRENFDRDLALQIGVGARYTSPIPPSPSLTSDLVGADARAWRHRCGVRCGAAGS